MAEIKSTLDLVMEKTKHLSLSSEEKETQDTIATERKISGLLQKIADDTMTLDELYGRLDELDIKQKGRLKTVLFETIFRRIDLDGGTGYLFTILETYCNVEIKSLEDVLADYQTTRQQASADQHVAATQALAEQYHISGSAVVPNLAFDSGWLDRLASIKHDFGQRLDTAFTKLINTDDR